MMSYAKDNVLTYSGLFVRPIVALQTCRFGIAAGRETREKKREKYIYLSFI